MTEAQSPEELRESVKGYSEEIEKKYDEKIKKLSPEEDEGPDLRELVGQYNDLKKEVSEARKKGKDVFIAHNLLLGFPGRLEIARATKDVEDIKKLESILKDAEEELREAVKLRKVDVRQDVLDRLREPEAKKSEELEAKKEVEKVAKVKKVNIDKVPSKRGLYFHLVTGGDIRSVRELMETLPEMSETIFNYHFDSRGINDFAEWINDVFGYAELAEQINNVRDRKEMAEIIKKAAEES